MRCFDQCLAKNKCSKAAVFLLLVVLEVVNCLTFLIGRDWRRLPILIKLSRENRPETPLPCSLFSRNTRCLGCLLGVPSLLLAQPRPNSTWSDLQNSLCLYSANTWGHLMGLTFICVYLGFHLFFHVFFPVNTLFIEDLLCVSPWACSIESAVCGVSLPSGS